MGLEGPSSHEEFVEALSREPHWTVTRPLRAFRLAWGYPGVVIFWLRSVVVLAGPLVWLGHLCAASGNYWIGAWAPAIAWSALIADRKAFGLAASMALFIFVGIPLSITSGLLQLGAALMPNATWIVAALAGELTSAALLRRLASSPEAWKRVSDEGLLSRR